MTLSIEEFKREIKQKARSATEIHDYTVIFFDKIRHAKDEEKARQEWLELCNKKEWVRLREVFENIAACEKELRGFDVETWLFKRFPYYLYQERYSQEKRRVLEILHEFSKEILGH